MTKQAPAFAHLKYLGTVAGPRRGTWGDPEFGQGIALRKMPDGTLRLYFASYNPVRILSAPVPAGFTGPLAGITAHGTLPMDESVHGLFWHEAGQRLYQTSHANYDANVAPAATLSRGSFDAANQLVPDGRWTFASRSDKMVDGGITELPDGRLAAGFGGYRSVVATGPGSMGAALTIFDVPDPAVLTIANTPVLSYPFSGNVVPRMHRPDMNYTNTIGGDAKYVGTDPPGYTTWADYAGQNAVWIETEGLSGLLSIWQRATGTLSYTNAQVRAQGWKYDLVSYGPEILLGGPENSFQPAVDEPFTAPKLPVVGAGNTPPAPKPIAGVSYEPTTRTLVIAVGQMLGADAATYATAYLFYTVVDPLKNFVVTQTETIIRESTVLALNSQDAIATFLAGPEAPVISDSRTITTAEQP